MLRDDRIPLRFGAAGGLAPGLAVLAEGFGAPAPDRAFFRPGGAHARGCACCAGRSAAAAALGDLYLDSMRAGRPLAGVVVVATTAAGAAEIRAALAEDGLVAARYRLVP